MERIIKECSKKRLHSQLDLISKNDVLVIETPRKAGKIYSLGRYKVFVSDKDNSHDSYNFYAERLYRDEEKIFDLQAQYNGDYYLVYHTFNSISITINSESYNSFIYKKSLDSKGYNTTVNKNEKGEIVYIDKRAVDKTQDLFVLYDYLNPYNGDVQDDMPEMLYDIINDVVDTYDEETFKRNFQNLLEQGIFSYFDENGKLIIVFFYSETDNEIVENILLFSKTNPGQPITKEEQQYLIEEVEKLRQDPLNYNIVW